MEGVSSVLTDERVSDVRPVDAVLQLQLVVRLDVEQEVLIETDSSDQVSPVRTLQSTPAVDVLHEENKYEACETLETVKKHLLPHNVISINKYVHDHIHTISTIISADSKLTLCIVLLQENNQQQEK